jgi:hypothetical protein
MPHQISSFQSTMSAHHFRKIAPIPTRCAGKSYPSAPSQLCNTEDLLAFLEDTDSESEDDVEIILDSCIPQREIPMDVDINTPICPTRRLQQRVRAPRGARSRKNIQLHRRAKTLPLRNGTLPNAPCAPNGLDRLILHVSVDLPSVQSVIFSVVLARIFSLTLQSH